jgi:hypothetical protein
MKPSVNSTKVLRNSYVIKLVNDGLTSAEIGRKLSISRQRVYQIRNRKQNSFKIKIAKRIMRGKFPSISSKSCVECGEIATEYDFYSAYITGDEKDIHAMCAKCKGAIMILRKQVPHGEHHYRARLTEADVLEIRTLREKHRKEMTLKVLSERYNVSMGCVQSIVEGRNWKRLKAV